MRKQIAAANWKMNLTYQQAETLLDEILEEQIVLAPDQKVIFAVPFPYLIMANSEIAEEQGYFVAAQNCSDQKSGAFTGEVSAQMLHSVGIPYCIIGHSERRQYYGETHSILAEKVNRCLEENVLPVFCCGEALEAREAGNQNNVVKQQLEESLFHLPEAEISKLIIAYEPVWAIGTGKTASPDQAQEMHSFIRSVIADRWGNYLAENISILYGGSVKAANAKEIFGKEDVDGGLVGGASLVADEFIAIIKALKHQTI